MKMENINIHDLLTAYMKQNYAGKSALVIMVDANSHGKFEALMNDLDKLGLAPPSQFRGMGFLIIEMQQMVAKKLINQYNKGFGRLELYVNGECVNENR